MGAVPGHCVLSGPPSAAWFDVEPYRASAGRRAVVRTAPCPALVLGSTQPAAAVDRRRAEAAGVEVVRRRSGGGAVLVAPGDPLWVDLWLPRGDPLWLDDVTEAAAWVGRWWASALAQAGAVGLSVHAGRSEPRPWSALVCFAGIGPGEVVAGGRKVVGVAQWRGRQGALFHTCAYRHWDPRPLVDLLALEDGRAVDRDALAAFLATSAIGTAEVAGPSFGPERLLERLPAGPSWDLTAI